MKKIFFAVLILVTALSCEREDVATAEIKKNDIHEQFKRESDSTQTQPAEPGDSLSGFAPVNPGDIRPPRR
ncbi:hypothetical protein [Epilithonimonas hominis]|uniref:hypothetical protein n=1 Tax=Epilithonimonas hominis TaxID=420404 RepID=UPI00289E4569|nr:hypothetical protein [Epilithonimonas hominis]